MKLKNIKLIEKDYEYHLKLAVNADNVISSHTVTEVNTGIVNKIANLATPLQRLLNKADLNCLGFSLKEKKVKESKKKYKNVLYSTFACHINQNGTPCGLSVTVCLEKTDEYSMKALIEAEHYEAVEQYTLRNELSDMALDLEAYIVDNYHSLILPKDEPSLFTN